MSQSHSPAQRVPSATKSPYLDRGPSSVRYTPTVQSSSGHGHASTSATAPTASSTNRTAASATAAEKHHHHHHAPPVHVSGSTSDEQVANLRERLLQIEAEAKSAQEAAQWTIKQNKNTLLQLKQENKDLQGEVARHGGSSELKAAGGGDGDRSIERLERQVHELRRTYDKLVKDKKTSLQKLDNLQDSLRELSRVAASSVNTAPLFQAPVPVQAVGAPSVSAPGGAAARELRQLENRLDKASVKANEAYSIRKTYEQVLERMKADVPKVEARIRTLHETITNKKAALQAAALANRESNNAKEAAKAQLAAAEEALARARAHHTRVLAEMREKAATLQQTNRALMQRQFQPLTDEPSAAGGEPDSSAGAPEPHTGSSTSALELPPRDLAIALCRASATTSLSDMVSRMLAQQSSIRELEGLRAAATAQRLALSQQLDMLRGHQAELQGGGKLTTQRQLDAAQEELKAACARADRSKEALDALLKIYADVRGGMMHLANMVAALPLKGAPVPFEDELLGDVLAQIEQRLVGAYKIITALPKAVEMLENIHNNPDLNFEQAFDE